MNKENKKKQQANAEKKKLTIVVAVIVAIIAIVLGILAFNNKPASTPASSSNSQETSSQTGSSTAEAVKEYVFEVTHKDGSTTQKTFTTSEDTLDKALLDEGVVKGDQGDYGLFVTEVDGETADYNVDGGWWKFLVNGEESQVGVSSTPVENGSTYSFVYTIGE